VAASETTASPPTCVIDEAVPSRIVAVVPLHLRQDWGGDAGFRVIASLELQPLQARVNQTGGNRSGNRSGPVSVLASTEPAQIQNSNLNLKNKKNSKNTSRCDESNGVKFSQKFVHLV